MTKFIKYILLVIIGLVICDFSISYVIERLIKNRYNSVIYSTYNIQSDIAILGASRAAHHYAPRVLEDSLHMTVANYGVDGHNIFTHYIVLNSLLKHSPKKPSIVILEISPIDINDTPTWNTEKLKMLYPYFYSEEYVRDLLSDVLGPGELFAIRIFGLYRHNSNYLSYLKSLLLGFPQAADAYNPLTEVWDKPIEFEEELGTSFHEKKVEYMEKFISLCKQEGIKLILTVSPSYKLLPEKLKWVDEVERIAEENNLPFYYHEKDSLFLSHREWFNDPVHLNYDGAQIYSRIISSEIKNNIERD